MSYLCPRLLCVRGLWQNATINRKMSTCLKEVRPFSRVKQQTRMLPCRMTSATTLDHKNMVDPYALVKNNLKTIHGDIRSLLMQGTDIRELQEISTYYFDGQGKAFQPMLALLMAKAVNQHTGKKILLKTQRDVALSYELCHSVSLYHDDVMDHPDRRRGKPSANTMWNHHKVVAAGKYALAIMQINYCKLQNEEVLILISKAIIEIIQGEFMQLEAMVEESDMFQHYLLKCYKKTASGIAAMLKSVTILSGANSTIQQMAYEYGGHIGVTFQLVDDLLDFVSSADAMGKPVAADLRQGLATAPVLFAMEEFPELLPMIKRRFSDPGDVERAIDFVHESAGLEKTRNLIHTRLKTAAEVIKHLSDSPYKDGLGAACYLILDQMNIR